MRKVWLAVNQIFPIAPRKKLIISLRGERAVLIKMSIQKLMRWALGATD